MLLREKKSERVSNTRGQRFVNITRNPEVALKINTTREQRMLTWKLSLNTISKPEKIESKVNEA